MSESAAAAVKRRLPVGAEVDPAGGGVHFRVWAPDRRAVAVVIDGRATPLTREPSGHFSGVVADARDGTRYRFRLDEDERLLPDPVSRFQPDGPHEASQVVDPSRFTWTDAAWPGRALEGHVIYEMHIGTFTPEGTWRAAMAHLRALRDLGITTLEIMPIAEFPGRFGWGYDGVDWFAPTRLYGTPDDVRAFVDRAHALDLAVILDVVYNHFGPDGNYLREFARAYFAGHEEDAADQDDRRGAEREGAEREGNDWGDALNFDGRDAHGLRELVLANVQYWIEEFHVDGYRLDATQQIVDASSEHILAALARRVRTTGGDRHTLIAAENEKQESRLARAIARGGCGLDALWNDDFHHSAVVALTGHREAYYSDYRGSAQELIACAKWGFLYQGQYCPWQKQARGTPALDLKPAQFVTFIENHDQVANSARGLRLHQQTSPGRYRAMTALLLLLPGTPLLFQGQEFASSAPFLFFADHQGQLAADVRRGRATFLSQFLSIADPEVLALLHDPADPDVFARCVLDHDERTRHAPVVRLHRDLLALRRDTPAFRAQGRRVDGAVLDAGGGGGDAGDALALRFFDAADRLVVMNLGRERMLAPISDPLLAPPDAPQGAPHDRHEWRIVWSSEDPDYGGGGTPAFDPRDWRLPAESLLVFAPVPQADDDER